MSSLPHIESVVVLQKPAQTSTESLLGGPFDLVSLLSIP